MNAKLILFLALVAVNYAALDACNAKCGGTKPVSCAVGELADGTAAGVDTCLVCSAATDLVITPKTAATTGDISILAGTCGATCAAKFGTRNLILYNS